MVNLSTPVCSLLGIGVPIVQAPIGSAATPELAAAVSNAGGLGMLAVTWLSVEGIAERVEATRALTDRPFGANLVLAFPYEDRLRRLLEMGVKIISTAWGDPSAVRSATTTAGATHMHSVGSVAEARAAAHVGVDAIVAQGWEAGGHVLGTVAGLPLIPAVVDAVRPVPVIAAGGISDGRGLAAALMLGAEGVWLGTRFLAAEEAATHETYRALVLAADADDARHTLAFDGGWAGAPHRALVNQTMLGWERAGRPASPGRPGEGDVVSVDRAGREHLRYEDLMPLPGMTGELQEMALYAGQSVGLVRDVRPAAEIIHRIVAEATSALAAYQTAD
ncbi:MAG: hypothetical protein QOJ81_326 [Chloroflexota bacterium]|jgi:NAD(P)H-dependent flavin oxidoreductase YrpB (nitropropane dioxygenase family)|nr:hypothetical protein [Chloroflexota bacterium]